MSRKLLIGGELVDGASTLDVINPATGQVLETAPRADKAQLETAIAAAKAAFPAWSALSYEERGEYLLKLAAAVKERADEFTSLLTAEQGKPLNQAKGEVLGSAATFKGYASMRTPVRTIREDEKNKIFEHRTPLGVVSAIAPWNFPLAIMVGKIAPALITGNTVVAKPAPTTPLTTVLLGEIAAEILPKGVLSIIVDDNDLGPILSTHPDIAKISFTGSTETGKKVMQSASTDLKRITLELGGNDAALVLDDADIMDVAPRIFQAAMLNAGQVCVAVKRVYVPRDKYDAACAIFAKAAEMTVVDDGAQQGAQVGPVQNKMQYEKVKEFLADANESGKVIAGGEAADRDGYFIKPTVVRDVPDDARIVKEEQFGPILPILPYDDVNDAIARINDCEYGLGGSVWGGDLEKATEVAQKIDSGTVWVNKHLDMPFDAPFGGAKQSGFGVEKGQEGLEEYTQAKVVNVRL